METAPMPGSIRRHWMVVDDDGRSLAAGFENQAHAQEWIDTDGTMRVPSPVETDGPSRKGPKMSTPAEILAEIKRAKALRDRDVATLREAEAIAQRLAYSFRDGGTRATVEIRNASRKAEIAITRLIEAWSV